MDIVSGRLLFACELGRRPAAGDVAGRAWFTDSRSPGRWALECGDRTCVEEDQRALTDGRTFDPDRDSSGLVGVRCRALVRSRQEIPARACVRRMTLARGRTPADNAPWAHDPVRRRSMFVEVPRRGHHWVASETNGAGTGRRRIDKSLASVWCGCVLKRHLGRGLQARCDLATLSPNELDIGRMSCLIGMAPLKSAESVLLRLSRRGRIRRTPSAIPRRSLAWRPPHVTTRTPQSTRWSRPVGQCAGGFSEALGPPTETRPIEGRAGPDSLRVSESAASCEYQRSSSSRVTTSRELWERRKTVVDGRTDRRSGSIALLYEARQGAGVEVPRGWPSNWYGPALDAENNEVAIETLATAHEGAELAQPDSRSTPPAWQRRTHDSRSWSWR